MKEYELKNSDPEDIEDLILKIEDSLGIYFEERELAYVKTLGQLSEHIKSKIKRDKTDDCTTQQAFYKFRNALSESLKIQKKNISPDSLLSEMLPKRTRIEIIKEIDHSIGFNTSILRPHHFITNSLILLLLVSITGLFFSWQYGLLGFVLCIAGFWVSNKKGKELDLRTVGEVAEKMTRENYVKSRRNSETYNEREIDQIITELFSDFFMLDKTKLTKDDGFN